MTLMQGIFGCFIGALVGSLVGYILCRAFNREEAEQPEEKPVTIKIKYFTDRHDDDLKEVKKIEKGDWIDLYSAEETRIKYNERPKLIPLGVGMILPEGYEAWVVPRSSTPKKFGIEMANSIGIIDNCFNGNGDEWQFPAVLTSGTTSTIIPKGSKICQFRIVKSMPPIELQRTDHLNDKDRGGFGTTGD